MPVPSPAQLSAGEAALRDAEVLSEREKAARVFVAMRETRNPVGRVPADPVRDAEVVAALRGGMTARQARRRWKLSSSVLGRLVKMADENNKKD